MATQRHGTLAGSITAAACSSRRIHPAKGWDRFSGFSGINGAAPRTPHTARTGCCWRKQASSARVGHGTRCQSAWWQGLGLQQHRSQTAMLASRPRGERRGPCRWEIARRWRLRQWGALTGQEAGSTGRFFKTGQGSQCLRRSHTWEWAINRFTGNDSQEARRPRCHKIALTTAQRLSRSRLIWYSGCRRAALP